MSEFTYYYDKQLKAYEIQFAAVFGGMEVEVGKRDEIEPHLILVPIKNASQDRVVGAIKGENTQNKPIRLPLMSYQLVNIEQAPELRKGVGQTRRNTYAPTGGLIPNDFEVVSQRMPVPYRANFELGIWASNKDQHNQIIEQILTLFDPQLQLQISDDVFDWSRITTLEMTDIRFDENIPMGIDRRVIQTTISFSVPIHLSVPADVRKNIIESIFLRVGAVSSDVDAALEALADLDGQGIEYEQIFESSDIAVDE